MNTPPTPDMLKQFTLNVLEDGKASDVLAIPLAGKSALADYMIVASGNSTRHISALAERVSRALKEAFGIAPRIEGLHSADWVLIDAFDIIIHIFRPEVRRFYALEKMWALEPDAQPATENETTENGATENETAEGESEKGETGELS